MYPFPPLPPPTNVGPAVGFFWPANNIDTFVKTMSFYQPTLVRGGRGGEKNRRYFNRKLVSYDVQRLCFCLVPK